MGGGIFTVFLSDEHKSFFTRKVTKTPAYRRQRLMNLEGEFYHNMQLKIHSDLVASDRKKAVELKLKDIAAVVHSWINIWSSINI